jgi:predicted HTH transcriptional regulator
MKNQCSIKDYAEKAQAEYLNSMKHQDRTAALKRMENLSKEELLLLLDKLYSFVEPTFQEKTIDEAMMNFQQVSSILVPASPNAFAKSDNKKAPLKCSERNNDQKNYSNFHFHANINKNSNLDQLDTKYFAAEQSYTGSTSTLFWYNCVKLKD